ncbi:hypothetical protein [Aliarcobacter cibarius]|jgi:hypothetical protein|uniref:Uncharacterized protein n=1 Tax=Aliarcobacter cibarius TaxID=255507 RepID=A0A5J6RMG4_9BACT|nr:hypothetical protein [Aliarcobacter cibarius]QEZ89651.1 hypothetical protein ACIB15232_1556 [Aliarcobacter cibarius]QKJ27658.1 hypothetical protein ACBT_1761 [Aliarcobacter cibarius]TLT00696.1 hypothetical protein FE247_03895 [Aliarcobacter cibarius]TLT00990.1 hypothetical protein FE245_03905 [Aliarcobacter cibarius]TLT03866.1 hypothetical protein FE248_05430 [Aliarcobacter cibarius]
MKKILVLVLFFLSTNLFADKWDEFLKDSGFPKKVIDDGSLVTGKVLDATVSYQIKNNDGIKGNFENSDSAKLVIKNKKGETITTEKFLNVAELRTWGRENFLEIFSFVIGDRKLDAKTLNELSVLATTALMNKNIR